jgi:methylated-DNA-protein-cysteine methyltransferase-like protein
MSTDSENVSELRTAGAYDRIYAVIEQIPPGHIATYGQIARIEGHSTARMVGYALATVPDHISVPWQRVLNAAGKLSERSGGGGTSRQRELLQAEGVVFSASGRTSLARFGWAGPAPDWLDLHGFMATAAPVSHKD